MISFASMGTDWGIWLKKGDNKPTFSKTVAIYWKLTLMFYYYRMPD